MRHKPLEAHRNQGEHFMRTKIADLGAIVGALCLLATVAASADSGAAVTQAQEEMTKLTGVPTSIGITEPLKTKPTGKKIYYMQCGVLQCTDVGKQLDKVGAILGVDVVHIDTGNTPETISAAFDRAAHDLPDGVMVPALPSSLFKSQLAVLASHNIPVVVWTSPDVVGNGIVKVLLDSNQYVQNGDLIADWIVVDSKANAKTAFFNIPNFPALKTMEKAYEARLTQLCPSCTYAGVDVQGTDIGKNLPERVVSYVQQHPDTNYIVLAFGSMVLGVPEALKEAGLDGRVKLVSQAGLSLNFNYIAKGEQAVDLTLSHLNLAFAAMDVMARAKAGQDISDIPTTLPSIFLTKDNLNFDASSNTTWPMQDTLQQQYKTLWGVR
jgi:ribose transport system substrate-binding protein